MKNWHVIDKSVVKYPKQPKELVLSNLSITIFQEIP